ncbi:hypothetical protein B0H13DRAFT_2272231 [Mycena leptocephala]|nr:hypothetical protein B0H13DRAFT_2272231 [Mycena leptocephala]
MNECMYLERRKEGKSLKRDCGSYFLLLKLKNGWMDAHISRVEMNSQGLEVNGYAVPSFVRWGDHMPAPAHAAHREILAMALGAARSARLTDGERNLKSQPVHGPWSHICSQTEETRLAADCEMSAPASTERRRHVQKVQNRQQSRRASENISRRPAVETVKQWGKIATSQWRGCEFRRRSSFHLFENEDRERISCASILGCEREGERGRIKTTETMEGSKNTKEIAGGDENRGEGSGSTRIGIRMGVKVKIACTRTTPPIFAFEREAGCGLELEVGVGPGAYDVCDVLPTCAHLHARSRGQNPIRHTHSVALAAAEMQLRAHGGRYSTRQRLAAWLGGQRSLKSRFVRFQAVALYQRMRRVWRKSQDSTVPVLYGLVQGTSARHIDLRSVAMHHDDASKHSGLRVSTAGARVATRKHERLSVSLRQTLPTGFHACDPYLAKFSFQPASSLLFWSIHATTSDSHEGWSSNSGLTPIAYGYAAYAMLFMLILTLDPDAHAYVLGLCAST